MENEFVHKRAVSIWREAQKHHLNGDLDRAIELYSMSIAMEPSAEAFTFRGWAYSFQKKLEEAIRDCERAIELDPDFGNPYNDIGSYLILLKREEEAVIWLEKAKRAQRYEPRHFPYMNLGRIYAAQGKIDLAIREFEDALKISPGDPICSVALQKLRLVRES